MRNAFVSVLAALTAIVAAALFIGVPPLLALVHMPMPLPAVAAAVWVVLSASLVVAAVVAVEE